MRIGGQGGKGRGSWTKFDQGQRNDGAEWFEGYPSLKKGSCRVYAGREHGREYMLRHFGWRAAKEATRRWLMKHEDSKHVRNSAVGLQKLFCKASLKEQLLDEG